MKENTLKARYLPSIGKAVQVIGLAVLLQWFMYQANEVMHVTPALTPEQRENATIAFSFFLAGLFFISSVYYFFLYFVGHRKRRFWIFGLFCLVLFLLIFIRYAPYVHSFEGGSMLDWRFWSNLLAVIAGLLLPVFLLDHFQLARRRAWLGVSFSTILLAYAFLPHEESTPLFFSVLISLGITVRAISKKRLGSWESLVGLIVFFSGMVYFDFSIYIGFSALVVANLFSLSITQRRERKAYEETLVRSSRLELELLKMNIRPHFLMNTLTNIISLIKEQPDTSIRLIEALSQEFYAMNEISDKQLIPIEQELQLCRSYLEVMRIRHDVSYEFIAELQEDELQVPPAVIHTLIENGITHSDPIDGKVLFELEVAAPAGQMTLVFRVIGKIRTAEELVDGTGIKYIKSRLEESYPRRWAFEQGPVDNSTWQTRITVAL